MSCCDRFVMTESQDEFKMWQGLVGAHYTPYVDEEGTISWTNNGGLPNPTPVNIKPDLDSVLQIKGVAENVTELPATANFGDVYFVGEEAPYDAYVFIDGGWLYLGVVGVVEDGRGIVSITKTGAVGLVDTYTIIYSDNTNPTTFTVTNGADGTNGVGVPTGGTTGQVLAKVSGTNYDTEWIDVETGGGTVQSVNDVLPDQNGNITLTADDIETDSSQSVQDALDNIVHVGTSAPSDPSVKIWLDTDEPGMSVVSSVNGATGTVVLDALDVGAAEWDLLWTNASPLSSFASQTISLDLSEYSQVIVYAYFSTSWVYIASTILCEVGDKAYLSDVALDGTRYGRTFEATTSGIIFANSNSSTTSPDNNSIIPHTIYGIKGVVTS